MAEPPDHSDEALEIVGSPWLRAALIGLGSFFVALGVVGAFLPLMPTTIFIILAAACYARASPRFYRWLLHHPWFGESLRAWRRHRSMPRYAKRTAFVMIGVSFSISIAVVPPLWVKGLLLVIAAAIVAFIWRIPTLRDEPRAAPDQDEAAPHDCEGSSGGSDLRA